jgi:hypothetical protein
VDHQSIARVLLAIFCALQGIATAAIDLGRTHAKHPEWLGHARFHVVWQTANVLVLSIVEIVLISINGPLTTYRFEIAAALAGAPMLGFFMALLTRGLYGATLSDPGGMPPWVVRAHGKQFHIDLNVVAEIAGLASLVAIVALYRTS